MLGNIYQTIEALGPTGGDPDTEITLGAPPGLDGLDGIGIFSLSPLGINTYRFTFTDGSYSDFTVPAGQPGDRGRDGITPTFAAGTITVVTVGGTPAATVRTSTIPNRYLIDFVLPVGPTGSSPWQTPPVPWTANTDYTIVAPASLVTNGGFTYVCAVSHTSGATFDASKWAQVTLQGVQGPQGTSLRVGSGVPSNALGVDGDLYLNSANDDLYRRASGAYAIVANIKGGTGATGATPFQTPPSPWAAATNYTSTAPASTVVFSGQTYVCSTSHTSGGTFDSSKWTLIAAKGADGTVNGLPTRVLLSSLIF